MISLEERFWNNVDKNGPIIRPELGQCWIWTASLSKGECGGYGRLVINGIEFKSHRVSWELAGHELPEGADVCHICDNRPCVRPDHLFLGDNHTNIQDMYDKGRRIQGGENNGHAKLTEQQVLEIIESLGSGVPGNQIAKVYGVAKQTIYKIKHGQKWNYLTGAKNKQQ